MAKLPLVKIYTRSFDLRLYSLASELFKGLKDPWGRSVACVRLTDKSADGYFYAMLRDEECDIAVNIDEDAFLTDLQGVSGLIKRVWEGGYAVAGYRDDSRRKEGDPRVTNPFFNILNLSLIRTRFDRSLMRRQKGDLEPYYPFFHFLADEFPILYLPERCHGDGITTCALDEEGRLLCMHTWYSRFYSTPSWIVRRIQPQEGNQKGRIDAVIGEAYAIRGMELPPHGPLKEVRFALDKLLRWSIKIPQRLVRLPVKLVRKYRERGLR